jgi:pectate lyase
LYPVSSKEVGLRRRKIALVLTVTLTALLVCAAPASSRPLQGFGADTVGGSGGESYVVTSLADSGPGTFRDAVSASNREITFAVGGTIELSSTVRVTGHHLTIDGSTAPDPGITITAAHDGVTGALFDIRGANDMIVRHIRVIDAPDALSGDNLRIWDGAHNIVVDHCSFRRAGDGNLDICLGAHDITVQWSILAETVKNSLIRTGLTNISLHHNLFIIGNERNPQLDDATSVDMVNNVICGWASNYGTRVRNGASANLVKNYYLPKSGSDEPNAVVIAPDAGPVYMEGNVLPPSCTTSGTTETRMAAPPVDEMSPVEALEAVLEEAGAHPRDADDEDFISGIVWNPVEPTSWGQIKSMYRAG